MKHRTPEFFLQDILECIEKIIKYSKDLSYNDFKENSLVIDAVTRNFEIIGEAAKYIPESLKEKYPTLPLKEMVGMRNILIHDYLGVDYQSVWQTIEEDLPFAKNIIEKILFDFKA